VSTLAVVSDEEQDVPLPAVFEHAVTVYRRMESEAELVNYGETGDGGADIKRLVWEGHLTKLFSSLHFSVPYYTSVTRELKRMGCISQIRRGGGNAASKWQLHHEPTEELFRGDANRTSNISSKRPSKVSL
jgi:hypothetical protein